ncbi:hypothetical protein [Mariniplasma anaerobium]|uniref:Major tropism determinant N-terminal domain-containing protein n=1 Tax=Mariniplasma anaerobium TaxID=2735436 RepID=A0A7U9TI06_9MOLU|nr:hypothetical protein [Mariniplasma anaerobium]BCR36111.1 hypothetical protein MPAN_010040 [Mariniplasma anaerobium]
MATIQIKRRTTAGTGPLIGTTGTVKAGEPQVDFTGEHLYIAKADKVASVSVPLAEADYLKIPGVAKVDTQIDTKITALNLGTASTKNTGTGSGNVPILDASGKLADSVVPKIAMTNTYVVASQTAMLALSNAQEGDVAVRTDLNKTFILKASPYSTLANWQELLTPTDAVTSVNGSTGVVTISLAGLGGVASTTYNTHVASNLHLTTEQRTILDNVKIAEISDTTGIALASTETAYANSVIIDGLIYYPYVDTGYTPTKITYKLGIDTSKVLQPASIIDGGTY